MNRLISVLIGALLIGNMTACARYFEADVYEISKYNEICVSLDNPTQTLACNLATQLITEDLCEKIELGLMVSTPVNLVDFSTSNALGRQLQQNLISAIRFNSDCKLLDANLAESLKVTNQGEFILSRNWKELKKSLQIDHLVISSLAYSKQGITINSRVVNMATSHILSSATAFASHDEFIDLLSQSNRVVLKNAKLFREEFIGLNTVDVMEGQ